MYKDNELFGVITLGKPRFNNYYEYEIIRLCWKDGIRVIGGAKKLFKHAITEYSINSLITYSNIDKFTGNVYERLGMSMQYMAEPNYVWANGRTFEVLSRYQTQKHKLIKLGLADETDTEDIAMERLGYLKIYNCGNKVFTWESDKLDF